MAHLCLGCTGGMEILVISRNLNLKNYLKEMRFIALKKKSFIIFLHGGKVLPSVMDHPCNVKEWVNFI